MNQTKEKRPTLYIVAGCNGVGKSTSMMSMLPSYLDSEAFVNADMIAEEMSPGSPESAAIAAGREMIARIQKLALKGFNIVIETTLSGKTHLKTIEYCKTKGYKVVLIFFWVHSVEIAIQRVKDRVQLGGHFVDEDTIRRRYVRGIYNLIHHYGPACDFWRVIENTTTQYRRVARKEKESIDIKVENREFWKQIASIVDRQS